MNPSHRKSIEIAKILIKKRDFENDNEPSVRNHWMEKKRNIFNIQAKAFDQTQTQG